MDPEIAVLASMFAKKHLKAIEEIIDLYPREKDKAFKLYKEQIREFTPIIAQIAQKMAFPQSIGIISPRLLRDPLSNNVQSTLLTTEEQESHMVGYLKAILELIYCLTKGLDVWEIHKTPLFTKYQVISATTDFNKLPIVIKLINEEIKSKKLPFTNRLEKNLTYDFPDAKKHQLDDSHREITDTKKAEEKEAVPFTARLMAYYRAVENKNPSPLIQDPYAERLAGDLTKYFKDHRVVAGKGDYPITRSYFIENQLMKPWCLTTQRSQIILLGAGLDTRAYRFTPLKENSHILFEIDFESVNKYKKELLIKETPVCELIRVSCDLSDPHWMSELLKSGFSQTTPSFWILEGLAYYLEKKNVTAILHKAAKYSTSDSQIFVDVCVPALAELEYGPFTRYFKWGINLKEVKTFFKNVNWDVSCSYADNHDQGRDVGQRGQIYAYGKKLTNLKLN
jgi:methyltransferase (TIGR00027 family)